MMTTPRRCVLLPALLAILSAGATPAADTDDGVAWAARDANGNGRVDYTWSGHSGGGAIFGGTDPKDRAIRFLATDGPDGATALEFQIRKKSPGDWAFVALTCGDGATGREPVSWPEAETGRDISRCSHLEFQVQGAGDFRLELKDIYDNGSEKATLSEHAAPTATGWTRVRIPLTAFGLQFGQVDLHRIKNLNILAEQDCPAGAGEWTCRIAGMAFRPGGEPIPGPPNPAPFTGTFGRLAAIERWTTVIGDGQKRDRDPRTAWTLAGPSDQDPPLTLFRRQPSPAGAPDPIAPQVRIVVEDLPGGQAAIGLGGSLTDSSAFLLNELKQRHPQAYDQVMNALFDPATGAGFNVVRLPVGASDYTADGTYYTYCDSPSPDLAAFSIDRDRAYVIPVLQDALRRNPALRIIGSPWSAPAWMKRNRSLLGVTTQAKEAGAENRLEDAHVATYARYLVKFLQAYAQAGVPIHGITLQNEPQFDVGSYPCMRLTGADEARLVGELAPALEQAGLATRLYVHDHNWILHPDDRQVLGGDRKEDPLALVKSLLGDPVLGRHLAGSAWHCYAGSASDLGRTYRDLRAAFPDKEILTTEVTAWAAQRSADWAGDVEWGLMNNWLATFEHGGAASLQWNLVLDQRHGPSPRTDSLAWGLVTVDTAADHRVRLEREFYPMAQIARAIGPGGRRLGVRTWLAGTATTTTRCRCLAFQRSDGKVGLVVANRAKQEDTRATVEYRGQAFPLTLAGNSLETLVWLPAAD